MSQMRAVAGRGMGMGGLIGILLVLLGACSDQSASSPPPASTDAPAPAPSPATGSASGGSAAPPAGASQPNPERNAYFGDLHVHTRYSFDAFIFGTVANPDDAYRYAQGESLEHPSGFTMQMPEPLDFYGVTDHAMFLGMLPAMADPSTEVSKLPIAGPFANARTIEDRRAAFAGIRPYLAPGKSDDILDLNVVKSAWADIVAAANRHNQPGRFTTFIAYEYTSGPENQNLHRNVVFQGDEAPLVPFSRLDSQNPEDLWTWMDEQRSVGYEALAIPHNSNGSNGQMFKPVYFDDSPLDADYAQKRMRNEPLVEITQVKGTSETHPLLSPNDEWADFEIMPFRIATQTLSNVSGSYVREALLKGIELEEQQGFNPFKFGIVGASDTHNASYAGDESEFYSKVGLLDDTGVRRGTVPLSAKTGDGGNSEAPLDVYLCPETQPGKLSGESSEPAPRILCGKDADRYLDTYYSFWSAAGLTGVWAEENTRGSIYTAFRRKETFGTSGPRIRVRFFAGFGLDAQPGAADMVSRAYATGVAMGGSLVSAGDESPTFLVSAMRDARSAPLQRMQIVKGWVADGQTREQVYDVACSDGLKVDPATHRCPDNGASIDITTCVIPESTGNAELATVWRDPEFDAGQRAFYYVRVLENPTCRWSTWDALRAEVAPRPDIQPTIQERAWSSPIWIEPK